MKDEAKIFIVYVLFLVFAMFLNTIGGIINTTKKAEVLKELINHIETKSDLNKTIDLIEKEFDD